MQNMDLNVGGLIGALVGGGVTAAIIFSTVETTTAGRAPYKVIILALIGGAVAGNFLWSAIRKKS